MRFILSALCESAIAESDGSLSLTKTFNRINCGGFPHVHPRMVLACRVLVPPITQLQEVLFSVDLIDPDGRTVARVVDACRIVLMAPREADESHVFNYIGELYGLAFHAPGDYQFSLLVNGGVVQEVPLLIRPLQS